MSIFRSKPNPYCSFSIDLGPLYIERVFDYLLTKEGVTGIGRMTTADRLSKYLDYLQHTMVPTNRPEYIFSLFYKGHFYQQLAYCPGEEGNKFHFLEKALCYYQDYLELSGWADESQYYAQWQIGILQDHLQYPWLLVESALTRARTIDPQRGEALRKMTRHFVDEKDWKRALACSTQAVEKHFNKNPIRYRRWFVDFDSYNWMVIDTHLNICRQLGIDYHPINSLYAWNLSPSSSLPVPEASEPIS